MYKYIIAMMVCILFLFSCAAVDIKGAGAARAEDKLELVQPKIKIVPLEQDVTEFYVKHYPWDSAIDPHMVIDKWIAIDMKIDTDKNILIISLANPRVDWNDVIKNNRPTNEIILPPGEITLVVTCVFILDKPLWELIGYGYDEAGELIAYKWNGKKYYKVIAGKSI